MAEIVRRCRALCANAALLIAMLLAMLSFIRGPVLAQSPNFPAPERKKIEDMLDLVRKQVAEQYYDSTYGGVNLQATYDSASAHIRNAVGPDAALGAIAWFALQLNDSHTYFAPPSQTVSVDYGWNMAMFGDSCFVISVRPESDAARQGVHVGDHVTSINGLAPTRDNLWQVNYLYRLLRPQPGLRVVMRAPGAAARTLDLAAKVRQRGAIVDLTGADGGRDLNQMLRDGDNDHETRAAEYAEVGDQILVWRMPSFVASPEEVRDAIAKARKRQSLVIDLRDNGGGFVQTMLELVRRVSRDSVVIGTTRERRKVSSLVAKGGGDDAYRGKIYVLVDSRSASASEIFARTMQLSGRGRVVGDRTAGAVMGAVLHPLSIGMDTRIFFGVQVTEADLIMSDGGRLERVGVTPDEIVVPTATDLRERRDPVLARALTLAGVPTDATQAGTLFPDKRR